MFRTDSNLYFWSRGRKQKWVSSLFAFFNGSVPTYLVSRQLLDFRLNTSITGYCFTQALTKTLASQNYFGSYGLWNSLFCPITAFNTIILKTNTVKLLFNCTTSIQESTLQWTKAVIPNQLFPIFLYTTSPLNWTFWDVWPRGFG